MLAFRIDRASVVPAQAAYAQAFVAADAGDDVVITPFFDFFSIHRIGKMLMPQGNEISLACCQNLFG